MGRRERDEGVEKTLPYKHHCQNEVHSKDEVVVFPSVPFQGIEVLHCSGNRAHGKTTS